jgi:hypothetical protein
MNRATPAIVATDTALTSLTFLPDRTATTERDDYDATLASYRDGARLGPWPLGNKREALGPQYRLRRRTAARGVIDSSWQRVRCPPEAPPAAVRA